MTIAKSTFAAGMRISGQIHADGDLLVEGHIEGGPLRVSGCLTVAAGATVQCTDTEVGEALVIGLFQGTLRARDVVRIHHSGRVSGDIIAPRVMFVSESSVSSSRSAPLPNSAPVPAANAAAQRPAMPAAPAISEAPATPAARTIPALPTIGQRAMERSVSASASVGAASERAADPKTKNS